MAKCQKCRKDIERHIKVHLNAAREKWDVTYDGEYDQDIPFAYEMCLVCYRRLLKYMNIHIPQSTEGRYGSIDYETGKGLYERKPAR